MPETAVELFHHISTYYRNQKLLLQTPEPLSPAWPPRNRRRQDADRGGAAERRKVLSEMESKAILRAFRIPVAQTMVARTPTEALLLAEQIGFPIAMKVDSPDMRPQERSRRRAPQHHQCAGGAQRLSRHHRHGQEAPPDAHASTASRSNPILARPNGRELMIGVFRDPIFGPIITFGAGGTEVEVFSDRAVALPPLNNFLAQGPDPLDARLEDCSASSATCRRSTSKRSKTCCCISEMVCELPWMQELDLNPLIVDENGAIAADARIVIDYATAPAATAIRTWRSTPTRCI
jgi:acetyltransferase